MRLTRLRTTAALLATTAGLTAAAALAADANAARVSSHPTGSASLDSYCSQAADIINQAFAEGDRADNLGYYDEGQAWWDTAIAMIQQARANGCNFSAARVQAHGIAHRPGGLATATADRPTAADVTLVSARPTGDVRLDARCRAWAVQINQAYAAGNATSAVSIRSQAEQKGCRYVLVQHVATAVTAGGVLSAS